MNRPLLRFCPPGMGNDAIVTSIIQTLWPEARTIFDPTWGRGTFWTHVNGSLKVVGMDIVPGRAPHGTIDVRQLPSPDGAFDLVVFDPPHVADGGRDGVMAQRYGTYAGSELEDMVRSGSREVLRVARLGALIKVTDAVHGGRLVLMSDWVKEELGTPFDVIHKTRLRPMIDPKWRDQRHAYNNGSTFLAYRKDT